MPPVLLSTEVKCWVSIFDLIEADWDALPEQEPYRSQPEPPPQWHIQASCQKLSEEGKETFFGSKDTDVRPSLNMGQIKSAKKICKTCPVIAECLTFALKNKENYGIWGGTTGRTRKKIWKGLNLGNFLFAKVIEDYVHWNIKPYENYGTKREY